MSKKILVLGNGPSINDIDFNRLDPTIQTYGVNRIWLKHIPTYFFFHDKDILIELIRRPDVIKTLKANSLCFTSDWIRKSCSKVPLWIREYPRQIRTVFPDSISIGLNILGNHILKGDTSDYTFYFAGVHLRWMEPSHFWKGTNYKSLNRNGKSWYVPRFNKVVKNLNTLQGMGYRMISVTQDSRLTKIMRSQKIQTLYK